MTLPPDKIGDHGQRYEIRCVDGDGKEIAFGWANDPEAFRKSIELHPSYHSRRVVDREAKGE